jgi:hypothetical protein
VKKYHHLKNVLTSDLGTGIIVIQDWGVNELENDYAVFKSEELRHAAIVLRAAFDIRTAGGEDDEIIADLIQALEDGVDIVVEDTTEDELL